MFIVYKHNRLDELIGGTKKSFQRWEQCKVIFQFNMRTALEAIYGRHYRNEWIEDFARNYTQQAIDETIRQIGDEVQLTEDVRQSVIKFVSSMKIFIRAPEEIDSPEKIESFYDELPLNGSEKLVESYFEMFKYNEKIEHQPKINWRKKLNKINKLYNVKYIFDENILCKFNCDL